MKTEKEPLHPYNDISFPLTLEQVLERKLRLKIYDYKQLSDKEKIEMFEKELIDSEEEIIYLEKRRHSLFTSKQMLEEKLERIKKFI